MEVMLPDDPSKSVVYNFSARQTPVVQHSLVSNHSSLKQRFGIYFQQDWGMCVCVGEGSIKRKILQMI